MLLHSLSHAPGQLRIFFLFILDHCSIHFHFPLPYASAPPRLTSIRSSSSPFTPTIHSQSHLCSLQLPLVHLRALLCAPVHYPANFNLFPFASNCFFRSTPSASLFASNCFSVHFNSAPSTFMHSYAPSSSLPFTLICSRSLPLAPHTHSLSLLPFTSDYSWVFPIRRSVQPRLLSPSLKCSLACFCELLRAPPATPVRFHRAARRGRYSYNMIAKGALACAPSGKWGRAMQRASQWGCWSEILKTDEVEAPRKHSGIMRSGAKMPVDESPSSTLLKYAIFTVFDL